MKLGDVPKKKRVFFVPQQGRGGKMGGMEVNEWRVTFHADAFLFFVCFFTKRKR